ncbi:unnamed protein product [Zymoseptoria tritici ST99CH_1A5]|uniref:Uncharacterized protein n=2 Tax=Zymoseptoria tritici TaxID=1047171 RepID=A0A2H1GTD4_ZYMTR|nr:unnamed protein product [Zymoseptoria tritici ST99CH_1E4]SMY26841.1 unnamed protein product [Zymoseptoria tritici ST99CH_1A5]
MELYLLKKPYDRAAVKAKLLSEVKKTIPGPVFHSPEWYAKFGDGLEDKFVAPARARGGGRYGGHGGRNDHQGRGGYGGYGGHTETGRDGRGGQRGPNHQEGRGRRGGVHGQPGRGGRGCRGS